MTWQYLNPLRSIPVRLSAIFTALAVTTLIIATPADAQQGAAVPNITLSSDSPGTLAISWSTANPAPDSYRIRWARQGLDFLSYQNENEAQRGNEYLAGSATSITLTGLDEGATYKMQIRARFDSGGHNNGPWSGPWSAVLTGVVSSSPPGQTTGLTATAAATPSVTLTWNAPPASENVTGFNIQRGATADALTPLVSDTASTDTSYTDSTVTAGATYHYQVAGINAAGAGPGSTVVEVTVPAAAVSPPTGLTATAATDSPGITLSWTAPANQTVTGYRIRRGESPDSLNVLVDNTGSTAVSYEDTSVTAGTTYHYTVAALNESAESAPTTTVSATTATSPIPTPTELTATASDHATVTINWSITTDRRITGYQVQGGTDSANLPTLTQDSGSTDTSFRHTAARGSTRYHYRVRAVAGNQHGPWSTTASTTTPKPSEKERVLVSNAGGTTQSVSIENNIVQRIRTGSNPLGYNLTSIELETTTSNANDQPQFYVALDEVGPGFNPSTGTGKRIAELRTVKVETTRLILPASEVRLKGNTTYAMYVYAVEAMPNMAYRTDHNLSAGSDTGWSLSQDEDNDAMTTSFVSSNNAARLVFTLNGSPERANEEPWHSDLVQNRDTAGVIHINQPSYGYIQAPGDNGDRDWFAVHLEKDETYTFFVHGEHGSNCGLAAAIAFAVVGPDGNQISSTVQGTRPSTADLDYFDYTATETGEHYFDVTSDATLGDYGQGTYVTSVIRNSDSHLIQEIANAGCRPDRPTDLSGRADGTTVTLTWTAPDHNAITGYTIFRTNDRNNTKTAGSTTGTVTTFRDTGVVMPGRYHYRVAANSAVGQGRRSANVAVPVSPPPSKGGQAQNIGTRSNHDRPPSAPGGLNFAASNDVIELYWAAPNAPGITGYRIRRGPTRNNLTEITANTGNTNTSYGNSGLERGTTYWYGVSAINPQGTGTEAVIEATTTNVDSPPPLPRVSGVNALTPARISTETLVSNQETFSSTSVIVGRPRTDIQESAATKFTTGPGKFGHGLESVSVKLAKSPNETDGGTPEVTIWSDRSGSPGAKLHTLTAPSSIDALNITADEYAFTAPYNTVLSPNTTYWVVIRNPDADIVVVTVSNGNETTDSNDGWTIGNGRSQRATSTAAWSTATGPLHLLIVGATLTHTDFEPANWDMPANKNTWALLTTGKPASGNLRRNADDGVFGTRGDWYQLQLEYWRHYRIRAKFGDNPGIHRGGGIDSPDDGGAWDHYRNDGRLFFDVHAHNYFWEYFINVQPADFTNEGRKTYYGDYTLTLTDITDFKQSVGNQSAADNTLDSVSVGKDDTDSRWYASAFTTGDRTDGYRIGWMTADLSYTETEGVDNTTRPVAFLYSDRDNAPSLPLIEFDSPAQANNMHKSTGMDHFFAPEIPGSVLSADTTYWVVFVNRDTASNYDLATTSSTSLDANAETGWGIDTGILTAVAGGSEWSNESTTKTIQFTIHADHDTSVASTTKNATPMGDVRLAGIHRVGETLTLDASQITDGDGINAVAYAWWRDNELIRDQTGLTYTLTGDDYGKRIRAGQFHVDGNGRVERTRSLETSAIIDDFTAIASNLGHAAVPHGDARWKTGNAQFHTGDNTNGYMINSFEFLWDRLFYPGGEGGLVLPTEHKLWLYETNGSGQPTNRIGQLHSTDFLTPDDDGRDGDTVYRPSSSIVLSPGTNYAYVWDNRSPLNGHCTTVNLATATTGTEDGWNMPLGVHQVSRSGERNYTPQGDSVNAATCMIEISGRELPTNKPHVKHIGVLGTPANRTWKSFETGETISIGVTFSAPVTGSFTLPLEIGGTTHTLSKTHSGPASPNIVFQHTVTASDRDDDGVTVPANGLQGFVNADLGHAAMLPDADYGVNAAPLSTHVDFISEPRGIGVDRYYTSGDTVTVGLYFNRPIAVTGTPSYNIQIGTNSREATYDSGQSTDSMIAFSYTLTDSDSTPRAIQVNTNSTAVDLDAGDSIKDGFRNAADKKDAIIDSDASGYHADQRVDQDARIIDIEITSTPSKGTDSDTYGAGDSITFAVTFNRVVNVTGTPDFTFTLGDDSRHAAYVSAPNASATMTFSYTVTSSDTDSDGISRSGHSNEADGDKLIRLQSGETIKYGTASTDADLFVRDGETYTDHPVDGSLTE